jgi:predicted CXXCH cytochrome family protein
MTIGRAALAALLILLPALSAHGRESVAPTAAADEPPGRPAASALESLLPRRCGVCHLDKAPPATAGFISFKPPGGQSGAGDAGICYSCHSGIVMDNRRAHWSGRQHPSSGRVSCGSCHTPHAQAPNTRPFMRFAQGSYAFCASCHPGRRPGDTGEHPAVAQDCGGCHMVHRAQGEGLIRAASAESLCGPCHGENPSRPGRGPGTTTHVTGKGGPACLECHDVHKTAGGKMMLDKAALDGRLCRKCHERNFSSGTTEANHPVAPEQAVCVSCHRMHNAERPGVRRGLLAVAWAEPDTICRRCHADVAGPGKGGAWNHPLDMPAAGEDRTLVARLVKSGAFFAPGGKVTCLSCHRSHAGRVGTPQLVTTREALCLYCHPAQNSLAPETAAPGSHPVAVKPKRARVDDSFIKAGGKTGPGGELTCATCHRAHQGRPGTPGLVIPRESYSCLLCHTAEASIASTPHSSARAPQPAGAKPASGGLCGGCHGEHGWRIALGEEVEGRTVIERLCTACHGAGERGAPFGGATNHPLGITSPPGRGTAGLPLFWSDGRRYRQGVITCATCHDVHRAGTGGRFLRAGAAGDLCVGCHAAQAVVAQTRHDLTKTQGTPCGPCHSVHDALLVASWPTARGGGDRAAADLGDYCGTCHSTGGIAAGAVVAESFHPVLPASPVSGGTGGKGVGCGGCHDPHRWNPVDAADRGTAGEADASTKFLLRSAAGPADLCVGCHAAQAAVAGTLHDLTLPDAKGRAPGSPDPSRRGVCAPCHSVHGAQPLAVAPTKPRRPGEKTPPGTDPCEICHAAGKMAAGATVGELGHPVGVSPGQDYGPDVPLFGYTGKRQAGGRIACATCHDAHSWSPAGGSGANSKAATSFLRIGADGYAPLCFPCHADKSMIVGTDHDLRVTAPGAVNRAGQDAETSGVCGVCHAMHRAPEAWSLWNRGFGAGRDESSRACTGCHLAGNDQGAHVPPRPEPHLLNYPGRGLVDRLFTITRTSSGPPPIPVYGEDGAIAASSGYLSCKSCHDVHRWEADVSSSGSGESVEGNVTNSFLRVRATALDRTLCAECHADSLLEHFNNYHFPEGK